MARRVGRRTIRRIKRRLNGMRLKHGYKLVRRKRKWWK